MPWFTSSPSDGDPGGTEDQRRAEHGGGHGFGLRTGEAERGKLRRSRLLHRDRDPGGRHDP